MEKFKFESVIMNVYEMHLTSWPANVETLCVNVIECRVKDCASSWWDEASRLRMQNPSLLSKYVTNLGIFASIVVSLCHTSTVEKIY